MHTPLGIFGERPRGPHPVSFARERHRKRRWSRLCGPGDVKARRFSKAIDMLGVLPSILSVLAYVKLDSVRSA